MPATNVGIHAIEVCALLPFPLRMPPPWPPLLRPSRDECSTIEHPCDPSQVYFPKTCVKQSDYEAHTGTPAGKYVVGLGQDEMAFVDATEDINRRVLHGVLLADVKDFIWPLTVVSAAS